MDIQTPQQPNTQAPMGSNNMPPNTGAAPTNMPPQQPLQTSNMQSAPLFSEPPVKKSKSAVIILVVVIILVIAAGVIFFMMSKKTSPVMTDSPVMDQPVEGVTDATNNNGAFGQQETSSREITASSAQGAAITSELNDINAELDQLDIDSFEEEFAEIDQILNDINF